MGRKTQNANAGRVRTCAKRAEVTREAQRHRCVPYQIGRPLWYAPVPAEIALRDAKRLHRYVPYLFVGCALLLPALSLAKIMRPKRVQHFEEFAPWPMPISGTNRTANKK